jgi:hypothetical protein
LITSRVNVDSAARANRTITGSTFPTAAPPNRNVLPTRYATRALPAPGVPLNIFV